MGQVSKKNKGQEREWDLVKKNPLKEYFLPTHNAKDYQGQTTFRAINQMFEIQRSGNDVAGALHVKFDPTVERQVCMSEDDLTVFNDLRMYKWNIHINTTKPIVVTPCVAKDLIQDIGFLPVLKGDTIEIPEGNGVTLAKLGAVEGFLVTDRIDGPFAERGPPTKRRAFEECKLCRCPNARDHEGGKRHKKAVKVFEMMAAQDELLE